MTEKILCSATWLKDKKSQLEPIIKGIDRGIVLCGFRHSDILLQIITLTGKTLANNGSYEHGFLTNKNRFVGRKEALEIASKCNQIKEGALIGIMLFSEDLY